MSLRSMLGSTPPPGDAATQAPQAAPSSQATPQPGQSAPPPAADGSQPAPAPTESQIIAAFQKRGFERPEGMSEDQFLDTIAQQIDHANRILDQQKAQQPSAPSNYSGQPTKPANPYNSAPNSARPEPAAQPTEHALPAQPAAGETSQAAGAPPKLSETAQFLAQHGQIYQNESGKWIPRESDFQKHADEYNAITAHRRLQALRLIDDPDEFLSPIVESRTKSYIDKMQEKLDALEAQLSTRAQQEQMTALEQKIESWISQREAQLFEGGDRNSLSPVGQKFNAIAQKLEAKAAARGETPDPAQIRLDTIELMEEMGIAPQEPAVEPAAPQAPTPPRQSFLQQAANAPPRNPNNRLTEIHPAQQSSAPPPIPLGPGRVASLRALIESQSN